MQPKEGELELETAIVVEQNADAKSRDMKEAESLKPANARKSIHSQVGWAESVLHYFESRVRDTRPFFCPVDFVYISNRDPERQINYALIYWYRGCSSLSIVPKAQGWGAQSSR
jgi:hypothetical protein